MNARKDEFMRVLGERIRSHREAADVSMSELARRAGISQTTMQHAEQGTTCSVYLLALIVEQLDGVTLDDLVPMTERVHA